MIIIIDYGVGNLRSVQKALQFLGFPAEITNDKKAVRAASGIILPGVGAFDAGIDELRRTNLESLILEEAAMKKPILGICLGLQMLFGSSEEGAQVGLSILDGTCRKFPDSDLAVPHMGWNRLIIKKQSPILEGITTGTMMYFAHSYYPAPKDPSVVSSETDYGLTFASSVAKENLFGVQFHPEKSGDAGLRVLKNFAQLCKGK